MKKAYQKPSITVVNVQMSQIICTSPGVQSLSTPDDDVELNWSSGGFADDEDDY